MLDRGCRRELASDFVPSHLRRAGDIFAHSEHRLVALISILRLNTAIDHEDDFDDHHRQRRRIL